MGWRCPFTAEGKASLCFFSITGDNAPDASSFRINALAGGQLHHAFHQVFFIADDDAGVAVGAVTAA